MKELPGHQQGGGDERKQGATTTTNANTGDHSHAVGTRIGQQMMLDLGQSLQAALNPELRLQRSATVQALLKTLHAEPAAGLAYFCSAAEVGGLQLLGETLQICCKVRRCSCGLGLSCQCPTDLVQPELLPLLQLLNQVLNLEDLDAEVRERVCRPLAVDLLRKLAHQLSRTKLPPPDANGYRRHQRVQQAAETLTARCDTIQSPKSKPEAPAAVAPAVAPAAAAVATVASGIDSGPFEASSCQAAQPEPGPAVQPEQQLDAPGSIEKPKQPAVNKKPDLPLCDECVSSEEVSRPAAKWGEKFDESVGKYRDWWDGSVAFPDRGWVEKAKDGTIHIVCTSFCNMLSVAESQAFVKERELLRSQAAPPPEDKPVN